MSCIRNAVRRRLYNIWFRVGNPSGYLAQPIFVIGCGRSGTTALADVLGQHPNTANVGEARHIWRLLPVADLWDYDQSGQGRLVLTAEDTSVSQQSSLRRAFAAETLVQGGERFIEKLPENAFRVSLLNTVFPDALFIHLLRDGREVADSIRRRYESDGRWYGQDDYKWNLFEAQAKTAGYEGLLPLCIDVPSRGLMEWRLAVEAARRAREIVGGEQWTEVRYEDLIDEPGPTTRRLLDWAGFTPDPETISHAETHIARRHPAKLGRTLTEVEEQIAGDLLRELQQS